ncbi:Uncharacterised protein [Bordetella pertussis]|nr:Uncharacterised protein [Bordetella pertussis]CFP61243.1 Uncharacterised protein [Bordetella pertussis]
MIVSSWAKEARSTSSSRRSAGWFSAASCRSLRQNWNDSPVLRCRPRRTFSSTVRRGNTAEIWNERMMPRRAIWAGRSRVMSRPLKTMVPEVGARNLVSRLKQVVLPAPLGPISAWIWPRLTRRSTPLTATKPRNSLVRPFVSRIVSSIAPHPLWFFLKVAASMRTRLSNCHEGFS